MLFLLLSSHHVHVLSQCGRAILPLAIAGALAFDTPLICPIASWIIIITIVHTVHVPVGTTSVGLVVGVNTAVVTVFVICDILRR